MTQTHASAFHTFWWRLIVLFFPLHRNWPQSNRWRTVFIFFTRVTTAFENNYNWFDYRDPHSTTHILRHMYGSGSGCGISENWMKIITSPLGWRARDFCFRLDATHLDGLVDLEWFISFSPGNGKLQPWWDWRQGQGDVFNNYRISCQIFLWFPMTMFIIVYLVITTW